MLTSVEMRTKCHLAVTVFEDLAFRAESLEVLVWLSALELQTFLCWETLCRGSPAGSCVPVPQNPIFLPGDDCRDGEPSSESMNPGRPAEYIKPAPETYSSSPWVWSRLNRWTSPVLLTWEVPTSTSDQRCDK